MNGPAAQRSLTDLRPGMILAADLHDAHGQVLLKAGTVLAASHIESLLRRGLTGACVLPPDTQGAEEDRRVAARRRLEQLFRHARPEDAWFRTLIEAYRMAPRA